MEPGRTDGYLEKKVTKLLYTAGVVDVIGNVLQCEPLSSLLSFQKHSRAPI